MEYLPIGENQLKITLSEEDVRLYGMELSSLSYASTETRRAFWAILDDAKHATGFDAAATRVSVQVFASRTGGCELFVSAIGTVGVADNAVERLSGDLPMRLTAPTGPNTAEDAPIGRFTAISHLFSACKALAHGDYQGISSAWRLGECYYLSLSAACSARFWGILREFGEIDTGLTPARLEESGICLCSAHAVERLSPIAT